MAPTLFLNRHAFLTARNDSIPFSGSTRTINYTKSQNSAIQKREKPLRSYLVFTHSWLLGFSSYWLGRILATGQNQCQKWIQHSRMRRNPVFSRFSVKKVFGPKISRVPDPWYGRKNFHGIAPKQWIPRHSTMLNPFLTLISRHFAPLPKFAPANNCRNPAKWPFWNSKVKNAWPWTAIILGMYLGACNVQMLLTATGSEGGYPCALPSLVLLFKMPRVPLFPLSHTLRLSGRSTVWHFFILRHRERPEMDPEGRKKSKSHSKATQTSAISPLHLQWPPFQKSPHPPYRKSDNRWRRTRTDDKFELSFENYP